MKRTCLNLVVAGGLSLVLAGEAAAAAWNVSLWGKRRAFTEHVEKLAELVSAKTNGEFTLNLSYGGLSKNRENLDGISIGAFEMAQFCAGYHYDKNPSITVLELPFLGVSSLEQEVKISRAVYRHPAVVADMARWNATLLMPSPLPQYNIAVALAAIQYCRCRQSAPDVEGFSGAGGQGHGRHRQGHEGDRRRPDIDVGDGGAPGAGQRRRQGGRIRTPCPYGLRNRPECEMVDHEPQPGHGQLSGRG